VEFAPSAATAERDWTDTDFSHEGPSPSRDHSEGEDGTWGEHVDTADSPRLQVDDLTPEVAETARLRHAHREWSWARIGKETDGSVASTAMRRYRKWEEVTAGIREGHPDGQAEFDDTPASERDRMSAE